ncbi:MAG: hypothetical protein K8R88_12860 [Armatimonadetes bacterium]|nr:hypothetical protein [Armatimonadota bacterium]
MSKLQLNYLSVQDIIFINLQVTKKVCTYKFDALEDASYYQYGYGKSTDLFQQAARFYEGFAKSGAFTEGNAATAFVGLVAFLEFNGRSFKGKDTDSKAKLDALSTDLVAARDELETLTLRDHDHHEASARSCIESVLKRYPKTIAAYLAAENSVVA